MWHKYRILLLGNAVYDTGVATPTDGSHEEEKEFYRLYYSIYVSDMYACAILWFVSFSA